MNNEDVRGREILQLVRTMLVYLLRHSDAMDTADGIRQWWLPLNWAYTREQVQIALDELVAKKWVITRGSADESRLYGLNKESLTEVMDFISGRPEKANDRIH